MIREPYILLMPIITRTSQVFDSVPAHLSVASTSVCPFLCWPSPFCVCCGRRHALFKLQHDAACMYNCADLHNFRSASTCAPRESQIRTLPDRLSTMNICWSSGTKNACGARICTGQRPQLSSHRSRVPKRRMQVPNDDLDLFRFCQLQVSRVETNCRARGLV